MIASSLLPLFSQLAEMSDEEKYGIIARFMPCDLCTSCQGWHPYDDDNSDNCQCGHDTFHHIDHGQDLDRRLKVALRLTELLQEKGKLDDYDYQDEDILSLKKQILFNASSPHQKTLDLKRNREDHADQDSYQETKKNKIKPQSDTENEEEEEEEEEQLAQEDVSKEETMSELQNESDLIKIETDITLNGTNNIQLNDDEMTRMLKELTQQPKIKKETPAMLEEKQGNIKVQVVLNDGTRQNMILLTGLKNIFQKQLPKMPKEYIARLVYDRNHRSIALVRPPQKVFGGICYRPFDTQEFAEIVFCAVASTEQVKGYGSFIMNHLKDYVSEHTNVKHFLTYADNYAVGYFRKQGFTTEITLDKRKWVGYIKDYEGGTIMQCTMVPHIKYLQVRDILETQRNAILRKMQERSTEHIVYPGLRMPVGKNGKRSIDPMDVPGIVDSGWTPEMDALSNRPRHAPHYNQMLFLVEEMQNYTHAWPFLEPVSIEDVADYYDIIKDPMDLATLEDNVKADAYPTMDDFIRDTQKIFNNCKIYNGEDTEYARCAIKLERFFNDKLKSLDRKSE